MNTLLEIINFVLENVWHTLPFFMVSIVLSVLVQTLRLDGIIGQALARRIGAAILLATLVGAFSPFCSCTVIPVVAGLLASGIPLAPIMSFWIASPTMDPEILTLSIGILGLPLAVVRLAATLLLSLAAGYATWALSKTTILTKGGIMRQREKGQQTAVCCQTAPTSLDLPVVQPAMAISLSPTAVSPPLTATSCNDDSCALPAPAASNWRSYLTQQWRAIHWDTFARDVAQESWKWGKWLLLAFLMEALILRYIPQESIANQLGHGNWLAVPLAALVGIPLYLTELSALPIVAGLLQQGMQPGAAIAFLIAGPVTTLPAITAVYGIVNRRIFWLYLLIGLGGAILFGFMTNLTLA